MIIFWHFKKVITFTLETSETKSNFNLPKNHECTFLERKRQRSVKRCSLLPAIIKSWNSQIFYTLSIMTFTRFAQEIYFYLLLASFCLIWSKLKIFIHSFHVGSHTLMNDFKFSSSEVNITESCIFKSNNFFWE